MNRDDVLSFNVNFSIPPNIIREYFDGLEKVELAKKSSTDYSILLPFLLGLFGTTKNFDLTKIVKKDVEKEDAKKEDVKNDVKKDDVNPTLSSTLKDFCKQLGGNNENYESFEKLLSTVCAGILEVKTDEVKTDEVKTDEVKTDEVKTDEAKTDEAKPDEAKPDEVKTDEVKTDEVKADEAKTDEVKADEALTEFTDCYEELAHLLNTNKRAFELLSKIKKDGNMLKLMQVVNNTTDDKKEVVNNTTDEKDIVDEQKEIPPNPLAGLASMFSGKQGGQGLNDMMAGLMKSTGQQNNPAVDNMMKSFGPVMESLMGGGLSGNANTTTTTTTQKKTDHQKTTREILEELEKNYEVD